MKTVAAILRSVSDQRPYSESRPVTLEEVTLEPPRAGELLVRIDAAGVCHSDLSVVDGSRLRPLPMALGHEATGIVEEVGVGVRGVQEGDRVILTFVPSCGVCVECASGRPAMCVPGAAANVSGSLLHGPSVLRDSRGQSVYHHLGVSSFARHAIVARESVVVIPRDVPRTIAPLFGCAVLTGVGAVYNTARIRPGQSVAVFGLGGVGLATVIGAVSANASPLIVVDPVEAKRRKALALGATAAFAPDEAVVGIKDLTAGGVEVAIEAAGVPAAIEAAFRSTRRGGMTVAIGLPHPERTVTLPAVAFGGGGQSLVGCYMGSAAPQRDIPRFMALWRAGRLPVEALHSATRPLSEINEAFEDLARGDAIRQILLPWSDAAS
jgi:Zn-dependent alcohol dehydrogenase